MSNTSPASKVKQIDHLGLTLPDLEAGVRFYQDALGGRVLFRLGPFDSRELSGEGQDWTGEFVGVPDAYYDIAMMGFGDGPMLELFEYSRPVGSTQPPRNNDVGGHHIAFTVSDLEEALAAVVAAGGTALTGPIVVPAGGSDAETWPAMTVHYILDPWGNQLELVYYPDEN